MTAVHQEAVTVRAWIVPERMDALRGVLATIGADVEENRLLPFGRVPHVHFARFIVLEAVEDLAGEEIPASLVYVASVDAPGADHLAVLAERMGEGVDAIFGCCEGYPEPEVRAPDRRVAFLDRHQIPTQAFYVNTVGRTAERVRQESALREAVQDALDEYLAARNGRPPTAEEVQAAVRGFVDADARFRWAQEPPPKPPIGWRIREKLRFGAIVLLGLVLLPVLLVVVPVWLLLIRADERRGRWDFENRLSEQFRSELTLHEDHVVHNQLSAVGFVKPGRLRIVTLRVLLWLLDVSCRHVFNRGNLGGIRRLGLTGVNTIHFARWIILDEGRRVLFCSNYDGSLESYMDDFINKIAWGLNLVFSNGAGYPKTRWLILGGARDEQRFKAFLRRHQIPTPVWYPAYSHLTARNATRNARIRRGLSTELRGAEEAEWLRAL